MINKQTLGSLVAAKNCLVPGPRRTDALLTTVLRCIQLVNTSLRMFLFVRHVVLNCVYRAVMISLLIHTTTAKLTDNRRLC